MSLLAKCLDVTSKRVVTHGCTKNIILEEASKKRSFQNHQKLESRRCHQRTQPPWEISEVIKDEQHTLQALFVSCKLINNGTIRPSSRSTSVHDLDGFIPNTGSLLGDSLLTTPFMPKQLGGNFSGISPKIPLIQSHFPFMVGHLPLPPPHAYNT